MDAQKRRSDKEILDRADYYEEQLQVIKDMETCTNQSKYRFPSNSPLEVPLYKSLCVDWLAALKWTLGEGCDPKGLWRALEREQKEKSKHFWDYRDHFNPSDLVRDDEPMVGQWEKLKELMRTINGLRHDGKYYVSMDDVMMIIDELTASW